MTRRGFALVVALAVLAAACSGPASPPQTADQQTVDTGVRAWFLVERELMLVDERLQMQATDGALAGGDAVAQLKFAAQTLLNQPISRTTLDAVVQNQQTAAQAFFTFVDAAVAQAADPGFRTRAAARMTQIRADYADAIKRGVDPGPALSSAYDVLALARGVQTDTIISPFDNAQADADALLPTSDSLPAPASAQPVTPLPPAG